ncbi:cytosine deaminase [Pelagibius sp. Alg239-R121]|uniref:cytosine deaminase n=1 Tax=Pelagibius sp. Alg239-R121 TaxID=2993448 RepID=UPI0024A6B98A|nr:cytosine deaminase [Pelagibius sp. Alg239-R121]
MSRMETTWITNVRLPVVLLENSTELDLETTDSDGLIAADLRIEGERIAEITSAAARPGCNVIDQRGGMVLPCFVDMHTHIDKGHIWPRKSNSDGTFDGALAAVIEDRSAHWGAEDVRRRMDFSLRCAYAHGTAALRTHLDSSDPQHKISWPLFAEIRREWAGRIDLQAVSILGIDRFLEGFGPELADQVAKSGGILGAVTFMMPELDEALDIIFQLAIERGLDLDFHSDETADPESRSLRQVAEAAIRNDFTGRIVCGHCCSIANQPADEAEACLDLLLEAGIAVVSLPMCNMYLQDRAGQQTPHWRGVTLLREMRDWGIPVAVASDNTRDPFYGYGDLDGLEVLREAVRILQLDCPVGEWVSAMTRWPADIIGRPDLGRLSVGGTADLVLFDGRNYSELLSRPESNRQVIRDGRIIDRSLPDYRELDDLMSAKSLKGAA